ncbi:MAG TPA: Fic family protein [Euryarchaeota archaeon]|nr:Fic family protein [Euryarchaeota archaeon]
MNERILTELRDHLLNRISFDNLPENVWKRTGALNTWGTNAVEGNTLTWHDVERLLIDQRSIADRPVPDVLETIQHETAFRGLISRRLAPMTLMTVLELHELVFREILNDAGHWRRINVRIAGSKYVPPRMEKVVELMQEYVQEYEQRDVRGDSIFQLGAWMHHRFESIHPFSNGNGRVGRLLLNLHFLKHNWPPVHILPEDKDGYYECLEIGHSGDHSKLEGFLKVTMGRSFLDLLDRVGTKRDELKRLKQLKNSKSYSAKYLSLLVQKGRLPAVRIKGDFFTSERALELYQRSVRRNR